jgi:hypothetical protein
MCRGRFVAILQPWDGGTAGGAGRWPEMRRFNRVKEEGIYRTWKSGRIRQHMYGVKAGIHKNSMGRRVAESAYT